jgi:hypothetical protein
MINELEKDLEGNWSGLMEIISRNFPGETVKTMKKTRDSRCPDKDSERNSRVERNSIVSETVICVYFLMMALEPKLIISRE